MKPSKPFKCLFTWLFCRSFSQPTPSAFFYGFKSLEMR